MLEKFILRRFGTTLQIFKFNQRSQSTKIYHIINIEKILGGDNLDEFISNASF